MIRLELLGADTRILSTLCASCPLGPTGCCASPPGMEWSDLGRIVSLGGRAWLLAELAAGHLYPGKRGLLMRRVAPAPDILARCVFHGPAGCTIPEGRRAATCNYYVCDDALAHGGEGRGDPDAARGRRALDALVALYGRWDEALARAIRARWPDGPPWDAAFLDWLGGEHARLVRASRRELAMLHM
jgi:hypothetical protein